MTYIKRLYLEGFKSFAKPTELVFEKGLNTIVGPNGSGKSNIADAICFVLGRLKIKSLRAARASNLIYHGGKSGKPSQKAKVTLVFDNSKKIFTLPESAEEVEITRIVKRDGTSIYKINGQTRTRQEVLELLAQAGIDPEGFNIILQAEIDKIIRMHPEEKRQIVEEIAGISVYEVRKEKSLHELAKTEEKLKLVRTVLNERSAYLRNLEQEKAQAERYEKLKRAIARDKALILSKKIEQKVKEAAKLTAEIVKKTQANSRMASEIEKINSKIINCKAAMTKIDSRIAEKTGLEYEKLQEKLLSLRTQLEALRLKREHLNDQLDSIAARRNQLEQTLKKLEQEISELELAKEKVKTSTREERKKQELEKVKQELESTKSKLVELENRKHSFYVLQRNITEKETRYLEKENYLVDLEKEINELKKEIDELSQELTLMKCDESMSTLLEKKSQHTELKEKLTKELAQLEKEIVELATKKELQRKDFEQLINLDKCPTCKQFIAKEHKETLAAEFKKITQELEQNFNLKQNSKDVIEQELKKALRVIEESVKKIQILEKFNEIKLELEKKKVALSRLYEKKETVGKELELLNTEIIETKKKLPRLEILDAELAENSAKLSELQEKLLKIKAEKYEVSDQSYDLELSLKTKELERAKSIIKSLSKEKVEIETQLRTITSELNQKQKELVNYEKEQEKINKEFKDLLAKKQKLQDTIHAHETAINAIQAKKISQEVELNELKIVKAKLDAEVEALQLELKGIATDFEKEIVHESLEELEKRLKKSELELQQLGVVNLKALEIYDKVKAEYDEIALKVAKLEEEKEEIMAVIAEIDKKKKQAFMQTFDAISSAFSQNFNALDEKGRTASLELENAQDPFAGGLEIVIKLAKGKYMDAESLSGGEKVITAVALLFAIQRYKSYHFYLFDEIDPALDKRNSERFAALLKENVKDSQCIIITHNDAVIAQADLLYGATMQDGITKIISLKV